MLNYANWILRYNSICRLSKKFKYISAKCVDFYYLWLIVVKAYQYTSITSIMLLDCWSIPSVILLTWLFLKTKYRYKKIAGVAICIAGLVLVIFSDVHADDRSREYITYTFLWSLFIWYFDFVYYYFSSILAYILIFTYCLVRKRKQPY